MEPILLSAAIGGFIIPFLNTLFAKSVNFLQERWIAHDVVVADVKGISMTILKIQAVVSQAEARQAVHDHGLILWLRELKDAAYEADDLLDELHTTATVLQLKGKKKQQVSNSSADTVLRDSKLPKRIKIVRKTLDRIAREWGNFKLGEIDDKLAGYPPIPKNRLTGSFVDESKLVGREEDKEKIIKILTSYDHECGDNKDAFILPVVGIGGVGKTTLVQLVYNDKRVKRYFHLRMWICVSNAFDARRITKEVVESASFGRHCETSNWDMLQRSLKEKLMLKRFLLVLDDVWSDDQVQWENLLAPLAEKIQGSKVVVTTRNTSVARIKGMMSPYILDGLSEEDSLSLFTHHAFVGKKSEYNYILEEMRKEIVEKLNGSPLAAKTLGRLCNSKLEKNNWKDFLKTEIWQMQQNDSDIMPTLKLTYHHLPAHLKQCFAFCSIFPKKDDFDKDDLVRMWMGQGFIQSGDKKRVEDIGNEYFDALISRGIFLRKEGKYEMPDLMNDLARFVSTDECSRIESSDELSGLSERPRHLSLIFCVLDKSAQNYLGNLTSLRTLRFLDTYETVLDDNLENLFKSLTSLRVLDLRNKKIKMLPECIKKLKHLRYLNLSNNPVEDLPPSLCELHNLQTLVLLQCESLKKLPEDICKLTNLRHLKIDRSLPSFIRKGRLSTSKVAGIGSLTLLQELKKFDCMDHRIGELKEMNELRGRLSIRGLENVKSETEAREAMLANKRHLEVLKLKWSNVDIVSASLELDLKVLEQLQPHPNIRKLTIARYRGINTPYWINTGMPANLKVIKLHDCPYLEQLPSLGHLFFLEKLEIRGMAGVTTVDHEFYGNTREEKFPSLRKLSFCDMPMWEEWSARNEDQSFPSLIELIMKNCPRLNTRPPFPPHVRIS